MIIFVWSLESEYCALRLMNTPIGTQTRYQCINEEWFASESRGGSRVTNLRTDASDRSAFGRYPQCDTRVPARALGVWLVIIQHRSSTGVRSAAPTCSTPRLDRRTAQAGR